MKRETNIAVPTASRSNPAALQNTDLPPHWDLIRVNPTKFDLKKNVFFKIIRVTASLRLSAFRASPRQINAKAALNRGADIPVCGFGRLSSRQSVLGSLDRESWCSESTGRSFVSIKETKLPNEPISTPPKIPHSSSTYNGTAIFRIPKRTHFKPFIRPNFSLNSTLNTATMRVRFAADCSGGL
jgi:hypothetical protein